MKGITGNPVLDAYGRMAVSPVGAARPAQAVEATTAPSAASSPAAEVSISSHARDLASEGRNVDYQKVEALRARIAEGSFQVDSHNVARRMLDALG